MPGSNNGTGQPLVFKCPKCRGRDVKKTGRRRPARSSGIRMLRECLEYTCLKCKHVGWSKHKDVERYG